MSNLALIARADNGGLATQSLEFWRHMQPERTLIVLANLGTRGACYVERYRGGPGEVRITKMYPTNKDSAWITSGVDWVFSAETAYHTRIYDNSRRNGSKIAIQANPELYDYERADLLCPATTWRSDIFEDSPLPWRQLPVPVNRDLLRPVLIDGVDTFYHVHSTAMEDRNGTDSVLSACRYMRRPAKLLIRGGEPRKMKVGHVSVQWLGPHHGAYHEHWLDALDRGAQALVLPRRYGGLCLPIQEAAGLGLPIICLRSDPYADVCLLGLAVGSTVHKSVHMKGGEFEVYKAVPRVLGETMDRLVAEDGLAEAAAERSRHWGGQHSWHALLSTYEGLFR